jgi:acetyl esterase/lipase
VGGAERLLADSVRFARLARMAGVDVALDVWDGMWHTWHYHRELPEAERALAEVRAFVSVSESRARRRRHA